MTMTAKCECADGSTREVELHDLAPSWTPTDVYDMCEDKLGVRVSNVSNLEDIMAEVEYLREFPEDA